MKKFLAVVLVAMGLLSAGAVKAQPKFGYISSQELLSIMPETRKADSSLQQLRAALYQNAQDKEAKLNADIQKFNEDTLKMSEAVKTVKRQELQKAYQELAGEEQRINDQLQQKQQELIVPIQKKANDAVQAVAKEAGYTYVFEKEALIVAPPGDDILQLVAKKLNIKVPGPTTPATQQPPKPNTKQ